MPADRQSIGFAIVRIFMGLFFLGEGIHKLRWLANPAILGGIFSKWADSAAPNSLAGWYLENIAIPGTSFFARLVPVAEISSGLALVVGLWTPFAAGLAFLLVLNYHVASGALFRPDVLTDSSVLPVLGTTLGLVIGGANLPWSIRGMVRPRGVSAHQRVNGELGA